MTYDHEQGLERLPPRYLCAGVMAFLCGALRPRLFTASRLVKLDSLSPVRLTPPVYFASSLASLIPIKYRRTLTRGVYSYFLLSVGRSPRFPLCPLQCPRIFDRPVGRAAARAATYIEQTFSLSLSP